jgi:hypothetical protein
MDIPMPTRARVISEIENLRPIVFLHAVAPLLQAVAAGEVRITAFVGTEPIEFSADLISARQWFLRRDGALVMPDRYGTRRAFRQARIRLPDDQFRAWDRAEDKSPAIVRPEITSTKAEYSKSALAAWFVLRVWTWPKDKREPSERADLQAALAHFDRVPRDEFRAIRREKVPEIWRKKGPRS